MLKAKLGLFVFLFHAVSALAWWPQPDPDHMPKQKYRYPVDRCEVGSTSMNEPVLKLEDLTKVLLSLNVSKEATQKFLSQYRQGQIEVKQFTDEIRSGIPNGGSVLATFQYDVTTGTKIIYVDFFEELGVLLPQFYHEMTHSLDPQLFSFFQNFHRMEPVWAQEYEKVWDQIAKRLKKAKNMISKDELTPKEIAALEELKERKNQFQNDGLYPIEYRAFESQKAFMDEWKKQSDCLPKYYDQQKQWNGLNLYIEDIQYHLERSYGLFPPKKSS